MGGDVYAAEHKGITCVKLNDHQILQVLNHSDTHASSFQALQYHKLKDPKLATAAFESLPTELEPLHIAVYWNLTLTVKSCQIIN